MTSGSLGDFWALIAQVVPVIALALVIEGRALARRYSSKEQFSRRWSRILGAIAFLVIGVALATAEILAIRSVLQSALQPDMEIDGDDIVFAVNATLVGLVFVLIVPLMLLVDAASGDLLTLMGRRVPWSIWKRTYRRSSWFLEQSQRSYRELRTHRIELLVMKASALMQPQPKVLVEPAYRLLEGITAAVDAEVGREFSAALDDDDSPRYLYRLVEAQMRAVDVSLANTTHINLRLKEALGQLREGIDHLSDEELEAVRKRLEGVAAQATSA